MTAVRGIVLGGNVLGWVGGCRFVAKSVDGAGAAGGVVEQASESALVRDVVRRVVACPLRGVLDGVDVRGGKASVRRRGGTVAGRVGSQSARCRDPCLFILSTLSSRMYVTSQLVVLGSVAEAYHRWIDDATPVPVELHERATRAVVDALGDDPHRGHYERILRYANQRSQAERITALLHRAGSVVAPLGHKSGRLAERLVQTRNALVHLPNDRREVLEDLDLAEAVELLVLALHANLLLDIGFQPERAAQFIARSYGQQLLWKRLQERDCAWPKGRTGARA